VAELNKTKLLSISYIAAILCLVYVSGIALRWSLADVYATQLKHHLDTVNRDSSNKSAEQWRLARRHLDRTLELRPAYARYFELAEKFYQRLGSLKSRRNPVIQELAWDGYEPKALDYARHGLRLTPSWPYLWNRLVINKLLLKQFDSELTGAIERAVELGPWEQSVQYAVAMAGLSYWPNLPDMARQHLLLTMEQVITMEQMDHGKLFDTDKILSHFNFAQACEELIKSATRRQLYSYCH
jgi:hypothetical protein